MSTTSRELRELLAEVRVLYDEARAMNARREELATVKQARLAYEQATRVEQNALDDAKRRKTALELRRAARLAPRVRPRPRARADADPVPPRPEIVPRAVRRDSAAEQLAATARRRELQRLVNRWAHAWGLSDYVLAAVNRVADDEELMLGEALVLLEWSVFSKALSEAETPERHAARLRDWQVELTRYAARLAGDIEALEWQSASALPLWEHWKAREISSGWVNLVASARRGLVAEASRVEREIARMREEERSP